MSTLHICWPGPTRVLATDREEPRWCFGCRKKLGGTWTCKAEIEPGYYGPWWGYACDGCGKNRQQFPGTGE